MTCLAEARPVCLRADYILPGGHARPIEDGLVVLGADGHIEAVGPAADFPDPPGPFEDLGQAVLMPGLVNAHQHGRGVSQLLMGYPDLPLESWMAGRRRHGPPDIHAVTRLAAEAMLANGVTATLHANYSYASGNYPGELEAQISAYRAAGLRATICVGVQDRGALVYPDAAPGDFAEALPPSARALVETAARPAWLPDLASSIALMDRLQDAYQGDPLVRFAWGPAGPQWVADETWQALAADAVARDAGIHFHLLESPAQAAAAHRLYPEGTLQRLRRLGVFEARASCAHGVYLSADDQRIAAEEDLPVVLNPGSNMRLFNGPPPVAALRSAGVALALGTDNCALSDDEDLLGELRLAALLGRSPDLVTPASANDLLDMIGPAGGRAAFLTERHGLIAPGAPADLAAFGLERVSAGGPVSNARLAELVAGRMRGDDCVMTMVAGRIRYRGRAEDDARLAEWRARAVASVSAREEWADATAIAELQDALRMHYASRLRKT